MRPKTSRKPAILTGRGRLRPNAAGQDQADSGVAKGPFEGLTCDVRVYRTKRGQTFLDAKLQKSWTRANGKTNSVRLVNVGLRVIEAITLGEKIIVPLGVGGGEVSDSRFELIVEKVEQMAAKPGK